MSEANVIDVIVEPDTVVVRVLADQLDEPQVQRVRGEVTVVALAHPTVPLVLDMGGVSFLSSMSLAGLIRLATDFRDRQQRLMLAGLRPAIRELFVVTHLDRFFDLQESVNTALRTLRSA